MRIHLKLSGVFLANDFVRRLLLVLLCLGIGTGCTIGTDPRVSPQPTQDTLGTTDQLPLKEKSEERVTAQVRAPKLASNVKAAALLDRGSSVYREHCVQCHGVLGDGHGELAATLTPRPSDFTAGVYKFRSTPTGELPTDADLFRTISVGVSGTAMADYEYLSELDRRALVVYLKSFSPRFTHESAGAPTVFPTPKPFALEAVARGRDLFGRMHCAAYHGEGARGDGPLAGELSDSDGLPIRPSDLTKQRLKSGRGPESVYRTVMTGLDGTPMPSYGDSMGPEEGWNLALYILSLSVPRGTP